MRIAVVENEPEERRHICGCIEAYAKESGLEVRLCAYGDGTEIVEAAREPFDMIFMDIDMEGLDGMEAARRIRGYDPLVPIVFITNMASCAIEGYSVQALDFLVKPVSALRMREELDKIRKLLKRRRPAKIVLKEKGTVCQVDADDIFYMEMYGRKLRVHCRQGVREVTGTLRQFEEFLAREPFFRCHHAFLVNLSHVSAIEKNDVCVAGERIPVSRQRKKEFIRAFAGYLGGSL